MPLASADGKSLPIRRRSLILLVAVPALLLAFLGLRTVRIDRLEAAQQLRERRTQAARLGDATLRAWIETLEHRLARHTATRAAGESIELFTCDRSGTLTFHSDRLLAGAPRHEIDWPPAVERLIERAQAAEVRGDRATALDLFGEIAAAETRLSAWAGLAALRVEAKDNLPLLGSVKSDQITPSGVPVLLAAVARLTSAPAETRRRYASLATQARSRLRAGEWWLTLDERRFYDAELGALLDGRGGEDARLQKLSRIARIVRGIPLRRDEPTRQYERMEIPTLLLLVPAADDEASWHGAALDAAALRRLLAAVMAQALTRDAASAGVSDEKGSLLWGISSNGGQAEALSTIPGWRLQFQRAETSTWRDSRVIFWVAAITLLVVTMLLSLAATIRLTEREAELARMQSDFIAGVSHDFKTPITALRLLLERIMSGRIPAGDAADEYRVAAERELKRLERHVDRLLEAQRIQAGKRRYTFASVPISEIVTGAVADLATQARAKQMTIRSDVPDLPPIPVDREALTDAVANLLGNAVKYSPAGTTIDVTARIEDDRAAIEIADEGFGIDAEDAGKIFERFYRGKRRHETPIDGSGLGLALVKATVQAHGGEIVVSSVPGKGSRFTIRLPLTREA